MIVPPRLRALVARVQRWWLRAVASNGPVRHLLLPFIPAVIFRLVFVPFQGNGFPAPLNGRVTNELASDSLMLLCGWGLVQWSRTWGVRELMRHVHAIASATQDPSKGFLRKLAANDIEKVRNVVEQLGQREYRAEDLESMAGWFTTFFADGGESYRGVDSHLPSEYMHGYDWYLKAHAQALAKRQGTGAQDVRVLISPRDPLTHDYARSPTTYQSFYRWHEDHGVGAKWLEQSEAQRLREQYNIGDADVALWENYAVLFTPDPDSGAVTLSMRFPGDRSPGASYDDISRFVRAVVNAAEDLADVAPRLELIDRELANRWESYVEPRSRASGKLGEFLLSTLAGRQHVLDAAAGIGCDSVFLIHNGFSVWSNEVDVRLSEAAQAYAQRSQVTLNLKDYLWETLPDSLEGHMRFDAVLVLGNSLCLVGDEHARSQCLDAFMTVLSPGGILVIDERNFSHMLDFRKEIMSDPIRYFSATLNGDVMYGGLGLRGFPAEIHDDNVTWRFFDNSGPVPRNRAEIVRRQLDVKDLSLYPFQHGELYGLLEAAGFERIQVFADLEPLDMTTGMPDKSGCSDADFLTYVAHRPVKPIKETTATDVTPEWMGLRVGA